MTEATTFPLDDWRANRHLFQGDAFRRNLTIGDELKALAAQRGTPEPDPGPSRGGRQPSTHRHRQRMLE